MEALPHSTGALATAPSIHLVTLTPGPIDHLPVQVLFQSNISSRLAAAWPVRWIGQGALPSLPWQLPIHGLVLVLGLWGGVPATTLTHLACGLRWIVLTAEIDWVTADLAHRNFPCSVRCLRVELITADMFAEPFSKRDLCYLVAGGGSPCQGHTSLDTDRQGVLDIRRWHRVELLRICQELHFLFASGFIPHRDAAEQAITALWLYTIALHKILFSLGLKQHRSDQPQTLTIGFGPVWFLENPPDFALHWDGE